jgi:eukaryotic-like serine/threonine-protein kinase
MNADLKLPISAILLLVLLVGSLVFLMPNMRTHAFIQPHIMETNSSSSSNHLNNNNTTNSKFSVYDNNDLGIKISYPSEWKPSLKRSSSNFTFIEFVQNMSNSMGPQQHTPLSSFITLSIENISDVTTRTLDLLTKQNLALANQTLSNFQLIESNKTTFGDSPANRIVYTFIDPSTRASSTSQFQSMNIWTIKGDNTYTLSYSQPTSEYGRYIPIVQRMIESFEIIE